LRLYKLALQVYNQDMRKGMGLMACAVVYYSLDGSTRAAAQAIAVKKGADVFELVEVKGKRRGPWGFMKSGFQAAMKAKTKLVDDLTSKLNDYDVIYIGTPIWAAMPAPAVNSFIHTMDFKDKGVYLVVVKGDPAPQSCPKAVEYMTACVKARGGEIKGLYELHGGIPGKEPDAADIQQQVKSKME
jgi:flavodoxin